MATNQVPKSKEKVKKVCQVPWCNGKYYAKGYCHRHYRQTLKRGLIYFARGTIYTPNDFIVDGDICRIGLYNRKNQKVADAIIDASDMDKCKSRKWYLSNQNYVVSRHPTYITLSNFLFDRRGNSKIVIDHKNGRKLDNRQGANLRLCTQSQNSINAPMRKNNISGTTGVWYDKGRKKWLAGIRYNRIRKYLGSFDNKSDAIKKRKQAELKYHGEFIPMLG